MNRLPVLGIALLLLISLPLLGVKLADQSVKDYLEFPPRTHFVAHAAFSWPVFAGLSLVIVAVLSSFLIRISRCLSSLHNKEVRSPDTRRPFPWWGWLGAGWTLCAWILAWNRFSWMTPFQSWTFTPLWIGYIVVINAWTFVRSGTSTLMERPANFAALFPLSAVFWWLFEYLNRFVQNWYYARAGELSPLDYFLQASIPFSTVLPAVVSTDQLLATVPRLSCGLDRGPALVIRHARRGALAIVLLAGAGLMGLGVQPNWLFPLVWVAPLVLIVGVQVLAGQSTIFEPLERGDWRPIWTAALASLICGIFWELWNWRSLAHWSYAIPYVDRFHLFAMPLLGYAGYLPFGLECLVVADFVLMKDKTGHEAARVAPPHC